MTLGNGTRQPSPATSPRAPSAKAPPRDGRAPLRNAAARAKRAHPCAARISQPPHAAATAPYSA
ncbi:hypothetical protein DM45_3972 [Burkholderia mallei]|nr:hypothetical protein DM46_2708 [Burkholderia mallei]KOS95289.1 hypothetical protein DM45_3972 [Burkholderia mallei]KOT03494.1 hypothetical protein DM77_3044 [Burkholderia mallei]KOT21791.1 hypothetical protein DM52_1970 [Burkholderia mallei]